MANHLFSVGSVHFIAPSASRDHLWSWAMMMTSWPKKILNSHFSQVSFEIFAISLVFVSDTPASRVRHSGCPCPSMRAVRPKMKDLTSKRLPSYRVLKHSEPFVSLVICRMRAIVWSTAGPFIGPITVSIKRKKNKLRSSTGLRNLFRTRFRLSIFWALYALWNGFVDSMKSETIETIGDEEKNINRNDFLRNRNRSPFMPFTSCSKIFRRRMKCLRSWNFILSTRWQ